MKNLKFLNLLLLYSCFCGCAYRWQPEFPEGMKPTVTVPFIIGDEDGLLTREVIRSLSSSGLADVRSFGGEYQLEISILGEEIEKIGFRVDPQKVDGKVRKNLLASEGRKTLTVQAALYFSNEIAFGPYTIMADAEYDYVDGDSIQDLTFTDPIGKVVTVLPFSLGQLESDESARHAANRPLYRKVAQKIVDAISSNW